MKTNKEILCDYKYGDMGQRLTLFLTYKELRREFSKIDRTIRPASKAGKARTVRFDPEFCGLEPLLLQE